MNKTISRQAGKLKSITYKSEYQKMALDSSMEVERLKRHIASLEDNLRDANKWANKYQQDLINQVEKDKSLIVCKIAIIFWSGFMAGIIFLKAMQG